MAARTLNELRRQITAALNETLRKEVVDVVKKTEQKHVQQDVYDAYPEPKYPKIYSRRKEDGGLQDARNMVVTEHELGVDIDNKTPFNNGYDHLNDPRYVPPPNYGNELEYLVEYGEGGHETYHYNYPFSSLYMQPRPFIHNTVDELKQGALRQTLIEGLRTRGIQAE